MKRILAGVLLGTLIITGCSSVQKAQDQTLVDSKVGAVSSPTSRVFTVLVNTKGARLTGDDVLNTLKAKGLDVRMGPTILDVVTPFGTPEMEQQIFSGDTKLADVLVFSTESEAGKAFELAKNPPAVDYPPGASAHYVLVGNVIIVTRADTAEAIVKGRTAKEVMDMIGSMPRAVVRSKAQANTIAVEYLKTEIPIDSTEPAVLDGKAVWKVVFRDLDGETRPGTRVLIDAETGTVLDVIIPVSG